MHGSRPSGHASLPPLDETKSRTSSSPPYFDGLSFRFQVNLAVTMWTVYLTTGFEIRRGDLVRRHNATIAKYQVCNPPSQLVPSTVFSRLFVALPSLFAHFGTFSTGVCVRLEDAADVVRCVSLLVTCHVRADGSYSCSQLNSLSIATWLMS
jgi:hypothetical protein